MLIVSEREHSASHFNMSRVTRKPVFEVSDPVRHKSVSSAKEASWS